MALFASFGQPQSFTENSFLPSCDNPEVFCEVNQPGLNYFNSHVMKRKRVSNEPDQPGAKRRHYEERMVNRLNSLDLSSGNQVQREESSEDELCIREIDPEYLEESPISFDTDDDSSQPIVEEPEEENAENFILSEELRHIMNAAKKEKILPNMYPKSTGQELVIWRPPARLAHSSPDDSEDTSSINSRIQEVIEEDVEFTDLSTDSNPASAENLGEIVFPEDSSSSRSSASPPLNLLNSSSDGRNGYQSSSSTSSNEGNLTFRLRQASGSNPIPEQVQPVSEEPMDLD